MENFEKILAKKLLTDYKVCLEVLEKIHQNKVEKGFLNGEISGLMDIAHSMWGSDELNLRSHFWFMETLKEIAYSEQIPSEELFKNQIMDAFQNGMEYKRNMDITIGEESENYFNRTYKD